MAERVVMIDGRLVGPEQAVISVYDRGFLYGDSIFEAMRAYGQVPFAIDEHLDRLWESARRVFIEMPVSRAQLKGEILEAVKAGPAQGSAVRVHVTRGVAPMGLDPSEALQPRRVLLVEAPHLPSLQDYEAGIGVTLAQTERAVDNTAAAGAKVGNYLMSLLALRDAHAAGAKEALIVDARGRVLEGTTSNVFVVKDGVVMTPPENEGILPGITRRYVMKAVAKLQMPMRVTTLNRSDLMAADEVFISSTVREVLPVVRVDAVSIGDGRVGGVTRKIHRAFRVVGALPTMMPWEGAGEEARHGADSCAPCV